MNIGIQYITVVDALKFGKYLNWKNTDALFATDHVGAVETLSLTRTFGNIMFLVDEFILLYTNSNILPVTVPDGICMVVFDEPVLYSLVNGNVPVNANIPIGLLVTVASSDNVPERSMVTPVVVTSVPVTSNPAGKLTDVLKYDAVIDVVANDALLAVEANDDVVAYDDDTPPLPPFMA